MNRCFKSICLDGVYLIVCITYLIKLHFLNKVLIDENLNAFDLIMYDHYKPLRYFFTAAVLFVLGGMLIKHHIAKIRNDNINFVEVMINSIATIVIGIILILIWIFIDNPIVRALLAVIGIAIAFLAEARQ